MNRKRDDLECNDQDDNGLGPMTKRIKSPLPPVNQLHLNDINDESRLLKNKQVTNTKDVDTIEQNGHTRLTIISNLPPQSSSEVCHNRKRRSRTSQELFKNNATTDSSASFETTSVNGQSRKKSDLSCVVCCGLAHGYNFDAISCESCKAFFRRNALFNMDRLKCRRDGSCDITLETRRRCKSCRLKKCFAVGMRKEWILTEEEKLNKKRRIEENRRLRLVNNTDEPLSSKETLNSTGNLNLDLKSLVLNKNKTASLDSTSFNQKNDTIVNVVEAFDAGFKLDPISYGWSYPLAKKITALCQILNTKNTTALRLISFYKRLPEFDALNEIDKVNLIKNNLSHVFIFHGSLGYDPINDIYHEGSPSHENLLYGADIREGHGDDIYLRCTSIMRSLHSIVQIDQRIIQLALIIILFSKGLPGIINFSEPLLNNSQEVFQAQNFYVEQLWLFMEKSYGPSRTVLIFSTLISKCLLVQELLRDIQRDLHEKVDPNQVPPIIRTLMHFS
ncbi:unnamed protein product [Adineta steineri]|uniref:Uncharacterized protein n=1 Tax=Adineta steineri TaxID=433720 RepID=A0A814A6I0_9BILA|nr:unnamed protein product [Adineta steineri]CAF0910271.1 unnamed protein product [Adineta steineri]